MKKYIPYAEKLKDQRWQKKRLELLEASGWKCQGRCCQNENDKPTLHVHHKVYFRNTEPWEYDDWAYLVVCDECHQGVQAQMENAHAVLARHEDIQLALSALSRMDTETQEKIESLLVNIVVINDAREQLLIFLQAVMDFRENVSMASFEHGMEVGASRPLPAIAAQ